jgi:hypothetical protein
MLSLCITGGRAVGFTGRFSPVPREQDEPGIAAGRSATLRDVTTPGPASGSPFKRWQWAELWALVLVIVVQLWLYRVSVSAAAAWGLLVPALVLHMYLWMAPLLHEHRSRPHTSDQPD